MEKQNFTNAVKIALVGVGGGGCNTINCIYKQGVPSAINLIALNTDARALQNITHSKILLGKKITQGLGAGMNPELGAKSAEESYEAIKEALQDSNIVLIVAGLGGGTGTGVLPIVAQITKEICALSIAVVTTPFTHEGKAREEIAQNGLDEIKKAVDSFIAIDNEVLLSIFNKSLGLKSTFEIMDSIIAQAVCGVAHFMLDSNNNEFDIKLINIAEKDSLDLIKEAIKSPLFSGVSIDGATIHYVLNDRLQRTNRDR